ncbi:MAG: beta-sandwich domain-containing protein [Bdellovibrio sp.]
MIRILTAVLLASTVIPLSAFAVLEDLPEVGVDVGIDVGNNSNSGGSSVEVPPEPTPAPSPYPSQQYSSAYDASLQIIDVSRRPQGQWYRVTLAQATELTRIDLQVTYARLRVHEVSLITEYGERVQLDGVDRNAVLLAGTTISGMAAGARIVAIDMRLESFGEGASLRVGVVSSYRDSSPILALQRVETQEPANNGSQNSNSGGYDTNLYTEFYAFASSEYGLNLPDYKARNLSAAWAQNRCEGGVELRGLVARFQKAFDKASNSWFKKRTSDEAIAKAAKKISKYSRCGDLLKGL